MLFAMPDPHGHAGKTVWARNVLPYFWYQLTQVREREFFGARLGS